MARLLQQTSQLARAAKVTRLLPHPAVRRCVQAPWISRFPAPASTSLSRGVRLYSTQKPEPPKDNSKPTEDGAEKNKENKEGESKESPERLSKQEEDVKARLKLEAVRAEYPLPEGWVYPTEAELRIFSELSKSSSLFQQVPITQTIEYMKLLGMPEGLRTQLADMASNGDKLPSLGTLAKLMRMTNQVATRFAQYEIKEMNKNKNKNTDGTAGAFQGQARQNANKQKQDGQESDKSEEGSGNGGNTGNFWTRKWFMGRFSMGDIAISLIVWAAVASIDPFFGSSQKEITWQEVRRDFLDKGLVEKLTVIQNGKVRVDLRKDAAGSPDGANSSTRYVFSIGSVDSFEAKLEQAQNELGIPGPERIPVSYSSGSGFVGLLYAFGPTIMVVGLLYWMTRSVTSKGGGQMFGMGKSKAKRFNHDAAVKVKFDDVAGMDEAKVEIMEFVSFLKTPEKFEKLGAKIPRGAILSGPPGTGKTLLAKATAGESGVPFFSISGSEFIEMFVGVGPSRVRDLFTTARKNAPCIIFIDEIDAIGRSRGNGKFSSGGTDERESTLNQILTEMDGFNTTEQVVVLAGTNRADVLDQALMRPGRFDRHIYIDRPTMDGRKAIFKVHMKKIVTNGEIEHLVGRLASLTPGFSGADIANVVNEAALIAARASAESVSMTYFEQAIERVVGGLERKSLRLNPVERRTVAYHEAGHAICGWFFEFADPLLKVSIIPRGKGALGYAQYLPQDAYLMTRQQLMDRMAMTLGGRVSEELHFPSVTTGGSDDFKKVTQMARAMVTQWGMSDKVGTQYFENDPNQLQKPFAESTAQAIDSEVHRIVDEAYKQCRELLEAKKTEIGLVAEELLKKEMLVRDDIVRLLGPRQWGHNDEFEKFFSGEGGKAAPPPQPPSPVGEGDLDLPPPGPVGPPAPAFRGLEEQPKR